MLAGLVLRKQLFQKLPTPAVAAAAAQKDRDRQICFLADGVAVLPRLNRFFTKRARFLGSIQHSRHNKSG